MLEWYEEAGHTRGAQYQYFVINSMANSRFILKRTLSFSAIQEVSKTLIQIKCYCFTSLPATIL